MITGGIHETNIIKMVSENAVIIIGTRGCCLCHVVKRLLQGLGVNPPVYEVDQDHETIVASQLADTAGETIQFPAVFVGGKLLGGLERVMATHISGELVPILKDAGALWL
jgi:glutaredoxin 3